MRPDAGRDETVGDETVGSDAGREPLAELVVARPVLTALLLALVPTVFDLIGNWGASYATTHTAAARVSSDTLWLLMVGACMAMCALAGVFAMAQARPSLRSFGWRAPLPWGTALWAAPLLVLGGIWMHDGLIRYGDSETAGLIHVVVSVIANVVWVQGFVQPVLRPRGRRYAMVTTSVIAAVVALLPQVVGQFAYRPQEAGAAMPHLLTRMVVTLLLTLVACGLVEITGSLWVALTVRVLIEVAVLYGLQLDVQYATGPALVALGVLAVWAGVMYTRLPADPDAE